MSTTAPESARLILTTWPDADAARACAAQLIEAQLIACAHISAAGLSLFRWNGAIHSDAEVQMWVKTTGQALGAVRTMILAMHPYEVPMLLVLDVDQSASAAAYLSWLNQSVLVPNPPTA